jgi:hypothetical protein
MRNFYFDTKKNKEKYVKKYMKKIFRLIQGSDKAGVYLLIIIGFFGVFLSIWSHFSVWETVKILDMPKKFNTGHFSMLLLFGLVIVTLLFVIRSIYVNIPIVFYVVYVLEKLFGTGIFRLIINSETHKLRPGLYTMLPLSALCMIIGGIGVVLYRIKFASK